MRFAVALVVVLAGCSLDFVGDDTMAGDDGDDIDDPPPPPVCRLADQYRLAATDCGPLPPDSPPITCWWTIDVEPAELTYCYSDVCESLTYECVNGEITGRSAGDRLFRGTVLPNGNLYWDGGGYLGGEYAPY